MRKQAAWAIGQIGAAVDQGELLPLLSDAAERVRDFAAFALARLGHGDGVDGSIAVLADRERMPIRRGEAAVALADGLRRAQYSAEAGSGDSKRVQRVRGAIDAVLAGNPDPELARRCRHALDRMARLT